MTDSQGITDVFDDGEQPRCQKCNVVMRDVPLVAVPGLRPRALADGTHRADATLRRAERPRRIVA